MSSFITASGLSLFDAAYLGESGGAWWVGVVRRAPAGSAMPLDLGIRLGTKRQLRDLYRDPTGGLWVAGEGGVRRNRAPWGPDADLWEQQELDAELHGITGVSETCVLVRGIRQSDGLHVLRHYNGARWNPIGTPEIEIADMCLSGPTRIWIAGDGVARWNGEGWDVLNTGSMIGIAAPTDDRVVALREDGSFGRITPEGFDFLGHVPGARTIAIWQDRIWIGAADGGLFRAGGGNLECVRPDRHCVSLEAHPEGMMIGCTDLVSSTVDGERFPGGCRGTLDGLRL